MVPMLEGSSLGGGEIDTEARALGYVAQQKGVRSKCVTASISTWKHQGRLLRARDV